MYLVDARVYDSVKSALVSVASYIKRSSDSGLTSTVVLGSGACFAAVLIAAYVLLRPPDVKFLVDLPPEQLKTILSEEPSQAQLASYGISPSDFPPTASAAHRMVLAAKIRVLRTVAFFLQRVVPQSQNHLCRRYCLNQGAGAGGSPHASALDSGLPLRCVCYLPPASTVARVAIGVPGTASFWDAARGVPVYIDLHGGGFCAGAATDDAEFASFMASTFGAGCAVISPDYPLAPEHPYPQAIQAIVQLVAFLLERLNPPAIAIGGFSAGATLALSVSQALLTNNTRTTDAQACPLVACVAVYPPLDFSSNSLCQGFGDQKRGDTRHRNMYHAAYLSSVPTNDAVLSHPLLSPRYARSDDLPPLLVVVAPEVDPNILDIKAFMARMSAARPSRTSDGSRAVAPKFIGVTYPDMYHGWTHLPDVALESKALAKLGAKSKKWEAYRLIASEVRAALLAASQRGTNKQ